MHGEPREAPALADFKREIRRLHGCASEFERFAALPEAPGRARRVVAVFALEGHPARRCYAWAERGERGLDVFAVLQGVEAERPQDAVRHVAEAERVARDRWAQEYA